MFVFLLLFAALVFACLAMDAHNLGQLSRDLSYEPDARARADAREGASVVDSYDQRTWALRHGIGMPNNLFYLWLVLAAGCFVAALLNAFGGG